MTFSRQKPFIKKLDSRWYVHFMWENVGGKYGTARSFNKFEDACNAAAFFWSNGTIPLFVG